MADKHHSGRYVKREQRELLHQQRKALGMTTEGGADFNQSALILEKDAADAVRKTIEQNSSIKTHMKTLDKGSPVRDEYEQFLSENQSFIELAEDYYGDKHQ